MNIRTIRHPDAIVMAGAAGDPITVAVRIPSKCRIVATMAVTTDTPRATNVYQKTGITSGADYRCGLEWTPTANAWDGGPEITAGQGAPFQNHDVADGNGSGGKQGVAYFVFDDGAAWTIDQLWIATESHP